MPFPWGAFAVNLGLSAVAVIVVMGVLMAVATAISNQSVIDVAWGPGFAVIAAVSYGLSSGSSGSGDAARRLVVLVGTRRALAIAVRTAGTGKRHTALGWRLVAAVARPVPYEQPAPLLRVEGPPEPYGGGELG